MAGRRRTAILDERSGSKNRCWIRRASVVFTARVAKESLVDTQNRPLIDTSKPAIF
jgi:hypothetical protein